MKYLKSTILFTVAIMLLISPACTNAKPEKKSIKTVVADQKETLRGFGGKAMGVVIEPLDFKTTDLGLTEDKIRADVEMKLKQANINVFPNVLQYLHIRVTNIFDKNIPDQVVYSISVDAKREVALTSLRLLKWDGTMKRKAFESLCNKDNKTTGVCERVRSGQPIGLDEKTIIGCTTSIWDSGMLGIVPTSEMEKTIRDEIKGLIDEFLNDYLEVNPKK